MTPEQFKEARIQLGFTRQADMAKAVGLGDQARVSDIENGKQGITETMALLVRALLFIQSLPDGWRPKP